MKYYYTYLLISPDDDLMYIGSRGCNVSPEEDTRYVSSSRSVSKDYLNRCDKLILEVFLTYKDALEHEIYLHTLHDVAISPKFFNKSKQTSTKFTISGTSHSEETKKKISEANKISMGTPQARERQRQRRLGAVVSDSNKQLLRELNLGGNSPKAKKVLCIETGMLFRSVSEAAAYYDIHYSSICKVCSGKQKTAAGQTWKYI